MALYTIYLCRTGIHICFVGGGGCFFNTLLVGLQIIEQEDFCSSGYFYVPFFSSYVHFARKELENQISFLIVPFLCQVDHLPISLNISSSYTTHRNDIQHGGCLSNHC